MTFAVVQPCSFYPVLLGVLCEVLSCGPKFLEFLHLLALCCVREHSQLLDGPDHLQAHCSAVTLEVGSVSCFDPDNVLELVEPVSLRI